MLEIHGDPGGHDAVPNVTDFAERRRQDELLVALSRGLEGWMVGDTTDAVEISVFADATGNQLLPKSPQAVERLLGDMEESGLVEHRSRHPSSHRWTEVYSAYGLAEEGWRRAHELESQSHEPSSSPL